VIEIYHRILSGKTGKQGTKTMTTRIKTSFGTSEHTAKIVSTSYLVGYDTDGMALYRTVEQKDTVKRGIPSKSGNTVLLREITEEKERIIIHDGTKTIESVTFRTVETVKNAIDRIASETADTLPGLKNLGYYADDTPDLTVETDEEAYPVKSKRNW